MYDLDVLANPKYGIEPYSLDSFTVAYYGKDDVFMYSLQDEVREAILKDCPSFPRYQGFFIDPDDIFHFGQVSVVGANALALYGQYVCETLLIPRMRKIQARRRKKAETEIKKLATERYVRSACDETPSEQ